MKIREVAARMREIANDIQDHHAKLASELLSLADELKRRPVDVRRVVTSARITPQLTDQIREPAEVNPRLSYQAIAKKFNVNPGRVSEALRGKRK
jgi:hypothetical protein